MSSAPSDPPPGDADPAPGGTGANPGPDGFGMGSTPSGPAFARGTGQPGWSAPVGPAPAARPDPATYLPKKSRVPAIVTAVAIGVVALVVAVATLLAHRADQVVVQPTHPRASVPRVTATKDSIEFTTRGGAGRLTILDHSWRAAPTTADPSAAALELRIRLECTDGTVEYDPFDFQAFDAAGNLFDVVAEEAHGQVLGVGMLQAGEQTSGVLAFVIPRGEATLLMSDDADSVTALRVPD